MSIRNMLANQEFRELIRNNIVHRRKCEALESIKIPCFDYLLDRKISEIKHENYPLFVFPRYSYITYNLRDILDVYAYYEREGDSYADCDNKLTACEIGLEKAKSSIVNWIMHVKSKCSKIRELCDDFAKHYISEEISCEDVFDMLIDDFIESCLDKSYREKLDKFITAFDNLIEEIGFANIFEYTDEENIEFEQLCVKHMDGIMKDEIQQLEAIKRKYQNKINACKECSL